MVGKARESQKREKESRHQRGGGYHENMALRTNHTGFTAVPKE